MTEQNEELVKINVSEEHKAEVEATKEAVTEVSTEIINKLDDKELSKVLYKLEELYPQFNRLPDFKLIGFVKGTKVPIWYKTWFEHSRYSGAKLREIREKNGVGRPPRLKKYSKNTVDESVSS